jgi:4-hydroxy-tetrahydrodipicolinate reductase
VTGSTAGAGQVGVAAAGASPVRVAVAGAGGRMGRMLVEAVLASPDCQLCGALDVPGSPAVGTDAGAALGRHTGVVVTASLAQGLDGCDVLIDFTRPEGTLAHLAACRERGVRAVVGTTGFTPAQQAEIGALAARLAIVMAPNMSVGVNVMLQLLDAAARSLGDGYDIEVIESHHRHKVDAPSGTALAMGRVLAQARGLSLDEHAVYARVGATGERDPKAIGFATVRGGDIVGEHTVLFAGAGERIEITHRSSSRANYAEGSLRAARFLARLPAGRCGLYGMADVLFGGAGT